jgi:hypothetical protein
VKEMPLDELLETNPKLKQFAKDFDSDFDVTNKASLAEEVQDESKDNTQEAEPSFCNIFGVFSAAKTPVVTPDPVDLQI